MVEEKTQVSWNIAADQAQHVSNLMKQATKNYLGGNLGTWYWTLTALRENVNHELEEDKRKNLDTLEKECNKHCGNWNLYKESMENGVIRKDLKKSKSEFAKAIREYQRSIMDTLKNLGFFPNKEDRSKLSF